MVPSILFPRPFTEASRLTWMGSDRWSVVDLAQKRIEGVGNYPRI